MSSGLRRRKPRALALPLLMFRVAANDPHHAFAVDQLAFVADFFD
jgi:hypothetical protein